MRYLITGGAGYFGRAFTRYVLDRQPDAVVCIYSRDEAKHAAMRELFQRDNDRIHYFVGDVRDKDRLARAMHRCDKVVHAAALKRVDAAEYNPDEVVKTNVVGTMNVRECALEVDKGRQMRSCVFLSTDKACNPVNIYGSTKLLAEKLFLAGNNEVGQYMVRFAATRYGNVAGSTGSVIPIWRAMLARGQIEFPVTDPECTRFYMTIREAVELVMDSFPLLSEKGKLAVPVHLPAYRLGDLCEAMGGKPKIIGLGAHEKLHEAMLPDVTSDKARRMTVPELREALKLI